MTRRRAPLWRLLLSWFLLLLFCLAAPLALVSGWARQTVRDPEAYARAVRDVADDAGVQTALAQAVTARTEVALAGENPTATEAVQARVLADEIGKAASQLFASETFRDTWQTANRAAYGLLVSGIAAGAGQPVVLDLSPLAGSLQAEVAALGLDLPDDFTIDADDLRIELLDSAAADRVRQALRRLDLAFWASLLAATLCLLLSIAVAPDRLAALGRAGFGLGLAMIGLIAALLVGQIWAASASGSNGSTVVVGAIVDAISQPLRLAAVALALAGLLLAALCAGLCALRGSTIGRAW